MMKKLLLSLACIAASAGVVSADVVELTMSDQWGSTDCELTQWTQEGFTFTPAKGTNAKDKVPVYKQKNKEVRFYALNNLSITAPANGEPMTKIVFTLSKQGREEQAIITPSAGQMEAQTIGNNTVTWTGSTYSLTLTVGETNSLHTEGIAEGSGQFDFVKISIVTGNSTVDKPQDTDSTFYMCNATADNGVLSEWIQGNLKFSAEKGEDESVNDPALKNDEEARFYAGNSLTISTLDGRNIQTLEFVLSEQGLQQQATVSASSGTVSQSKGSNISWAGNTNSVTLTVGVNDFGTNPSKKGQFDFNQINLTYVIASGIADIISENDYNSVEYYNLQGVKIGKPSTTGIFIRRIGNKADKFVIK